MEPKVQKLKFLSLNEKVIKRVDFDLKPQGKHSALKSEHSHSSQGNAMPKSSLKSSKYQLGGPNVYKNQG